MREMVAGFLFCKFPMGHDHVLLVEKASDGWEKIGFPRGLWNGVGGKREGRELLGVAMDREFQEETGLVRLDWHNFASETHPGEYVVHFFRARIGWSNTLVDNTHNVINDANEILRWHMVKELAGLPMVGNLRWLIPLAQDWRGFHADIVLTPARRTIS